MSVFFSFLFCLLGLHVSHTFNVIFFVLPSLFRFSLGFMMIKNCSIQFLIGESFQLKTNETNKQFNEIRQKNISDLFKEYQDSDENSVENCDITYGYNIYVEKLKYTLVSAII